MQRLRPKLHFRRTIWVPLNNIILTIHQQNLLFLPIKSYIYIRHMKNNKGKLLQKTRKILLLNPFTKFNIIYQTQKEKSKPIKNLDLQIPPFFSMQIKTSQEITRTSFILKAYIRTFIS